MINLTLLLYSLNRRRFICMFLVCTYVLVPCSYWSFSRIESPCPTLIGHTWSHEEVYSPSDCSTAVLHAQLEDLGLFVFTLFLSFILIRFGARLSSLPLIAKQRGTAPPAISILQAMIAFKLSLAKPTLSLSKPARDQLEFKFKVLMM